MKVKTLYHLFLLSGVMLAACSSQSPPPPPMLTIQNFTVNRPLTNTASQVMISIPQVFSSDVSVEYTTIDGSAHAGVDFLSIQGTATIPAGQLNASIPVTIVGDSLRQADLLFSMVFSNPKNCMLPGTQVANTIINVNNSYLPIANDGYTAASSYPGYSLVWQDEFTGKSINSSVWSFELGNSGWGNNELENYTASRNNSFVTGGYLVIEARQESLGGSSYTSARMITKDKKAFTYGRVDIRAKLPYGKGIWPALWMLGSNISTVGWPTCGEIDIMELIGNQPSTVYGTLHWGPVHQSAGSNHSLSSGIFNDQFHVFSLIWSASSMSILVDDVPYFTRANDNTLPFNSDFFFIFNVAVGGNWPGSPDASTVFPQRMIVDYIRVYQ